MLENDNIEAEVINARFLKPFDKETIKNSIEKTKKVITIEDGTIINGLATTVKELIIEENIKDVEMQNYSYPDKFIEHGNVEELEKLYKQDAEYLQKSERNSMNKQDLLKDYKRQEDKICLSQVLDKIEFCRSREKLEYTDFLDMYQISLVENFLRKISFKNYKLYGGYEDSERKVLIIYPEKYNDKMIEKNYNKILKLIRVELPEEEQGKYTHRNYLGGIVKLRFKKRKGRRYFSFK